ncbi:hypothetical protein TL16_g02872 [Triparma laevis f. inornata]|uniref:Fibronectin type III-like domain-containing protein n=2 Tax=Triparma laevis TaxID=1534972 RepID=A0A9W7KUK0_9STRA|nr:hypothetical protein TL16_g02872 [Triparma laevis f. inornata]GMI11825.1 hypothetical protein TrLO_g14755 [Triparma laevis f. longispina]
MKFFTFFAVASPLFASTVFADEANPVLVNPCVDTTDFLTADFCNVTLPLSARVADAIKRMTLDEKISALDSDTPEIPSLGLNRYNWWSEASSGVDTHGADDSGTKTTKFAFPITTGMSFNRTMWKATGQQIGREARALMNAGKAWSTFWAPVVNLAREPRWGRNIEVSSEDPFQSGEYATAFVTGFQEAPEDPRYVQASACCKHFIANEMEGSTEDGHEEDRQHVDSAVSQQDLMDSYMPPFQRCVEKGKVTSLMCSYNAVNGVPSCANDWLLTTVARDNWGFDGTIVSDCDADSDVFNSHYYTDTPEETVRDVLRAGTDIDCGDFVGTNAQSALDKGVITEADIDERLTQAFKLRFRLQHFDPVGPLQSISEADTVCSDHAIELSHDGLIQSAALLKNDDSTLPFSASSLNDVVVIGPNFNLSQSTAGYYGPDNHCLDAFTLVDSIAQFVDATGMAGVPDVLSDDTSGISDAVEAAKKADQVVLAVGTDLTWAREGTDAASIAFTNAQAELISKVSAAASKPVVLVIFTATPLDLTDVLANENIGAVLHVGQPSVTIMGAGDLLFGKTSPAGRTIQTVYKREYQDQISIFDFNMRPGPSPFARPDCTEDNYGDCEKGTNPGRTYRFFTGDAVVPFGFGLSYTSFDYEIVSAPKTVSMAPVEKMLASTKDQNKLFSSVEEQESGDTGYIVKVTNTGDIDADEVVLGFVTPPGAGENGTPLKSLFGFERVHVKAGESVEVTLYPGLADFTLVDEEGARSAAHGEYSFSFGVEETVVGGGGFARHTVSTEA